MRSFDIMDALTDMDDDILLRAEADPPMRRNVLSHAFRYAAAACLTLVLAVTTWLAVDVTAGGEVLRWTVRYREDRVTYLFKGGAELEGQMPNYVPTWLPEGYVLIWDNWGILDDRSFTYMKLGNQQDFVSFDYQHISDREAMNFYNLAEGTYERKSVEVNGLPGELYFNMEYPGCMLLWIDKEDHLVFTLSFTENDPEAVLRIAESVTLAP